MFRKPKKLAGKSAFRSKQNRDTNQNKGDDDDDDHGGKRVKAFRQRSSGDNDSDEGGGDDQGESTSDILEQLRREKEPNKKRRVDGPTSSSTGNSSIMHRFEATGEKMTDSEMATRGSEHHPKEITRGGEDESSKDDNGGASSLAVEEPPAGGDGIYRGTKTTRNKFLAGPLKAPTFVRTTCRFDYQPDICKDYKDTGFCGYGDTCIYLHDRGDTLSGWQLEKEWEDRKQKEREKKEKEMDRFVSGNGNDSDDNIAALDDGLPFGCHLCRSPFTDPVVTTCGHYFCEKCIMDRVRSTGPMSNDDGTNSSLCPICNKDTHGVFNHPTKLVSKKRRMVGSKGTWQEFADAKRNVKS